MLANVIYKLSDTSTTHIPYRDSKLTQILRSALGGNSLTSLICTLSPNVDHTNLSFSTLRFATRAKKVENRARVNEVIDDHKLLMVYKKKVAVLEKRVMQLENIIVESNKVKEDSEMTVAQCKMRLADLDQMNADLRFQLEQLRYDNEQLASNYQRETQTLEIVRKLYNNNFARESTEAETQTEGSPSQPSKVNSSAPGKSLGFRHTRPESGRVPATQKL